MNNTDLFLGGMVTGAVLCLAIVVGFYLQPRVGRRRRRGGDGEGMRRAVNEAYDAGRARGREEALGRLVPRPRMEVRSRANGGWIGTTRGVVVADRGEGAL